MRIAFENEWNTYGQVSELQHVLTAFDGHLHIWNLQLTRIQPLSCKTACSCGFAILRDVAVSVCRACWCIRSGGETLLSRPRKRMQDLSGESEECGFKQGNAFSRPLHYTLTELFVPHQEVIEFDLQSVFPEEKTASETVSVGELVAYSEVVEEFPEGSFHGGGRKGSGWSIVARVLSGKDLDGEDAVLIEAGLEGKALGDSNGRDELTYHDDEEWGGKMWE